MQNYEVDSDGITSSKIKHALTRSMTISHGKAVEVDKIVEIPDTTANSSIQKRRGSLFPGELLNNPNP